MLLDRAASLSARILDYEKLKGMADEGEKFETRAKQLGPICERVSGTRLALEKFAAAGVKVNFSPTNGAVYATRARALRAALQDNPAAISNPPFDLKNEFIDRLAGIVTAAEKAMSEAWKVFVAERAAFGSSDVLNALAAVPQFGSSVTKIRRCRADIEELANRLPSNPQATVTRLSELVATHDAAWSQLSADDIPANVITFIRAAANDGASLTAYSGEVQAWIEIKDLLGAFRIRLR